MLGGRKRIEQLEYISKRRSDLEDAMLKRISRLEADIMEMQKKLDENIIGHDLVHRPEPVDKYAKMRTSDGLLSYQTYKARKSGIGGE